MNMFKANKKNVPELKHKNTSLLLPSNSERENENFKQRVRLKKKIKNLFNVNYNKSASSCYPCMNACKKVNKKIKGRKLSKVSKREMAEILRFQFPLN